MFQLYKKKQKNKQTKNKPDTTYLAERPKNVSVKMLR